MSTSSQHQSTMITQGLDILPRVNLNRKVNESTNMVTDPFISNTKNISDS